MRNLLMLAGCSESVSPQTAPGAKAIEAKSMRLSPSCAVDYHNYLQPPNTKASPSDHLSQVKRVCSQASSDHGGERAVDRLIAQGTNAILSKGHEISRCRSCHCYVCLIALLSTL